MAFVNLQIKLDELPSADGLEFEPMAEAYEKEVKTQQMIIWLPLLAASLVPLLVFQKGFLVFIPVLILVLAALIVPLVIGKSRVKGIALREHDMAFRSGLYWRKTVLLAFSRIQHVEVSSGPLQRRYGLASLKFFTAGGSGVDLKVDGLAQARAAQVRSFILERRGDTETA